MKKFIILCISIVVVVTLGFMTVYFLSSSEYTSYDKSLDSITMIKGGERDIAIVVNNIENNTGVDSFSITHTDLISVTNAEAKPIESNGNARNQKIYTYTIKGEKAGSDKISITFTSANDLKTVINIAVSVTDGSSIYPYQIENAVQLSLIGAEGSLFGMDNFYKVTKDIVLDSAWKPISGEFVGNFNGNGYTIMNMKYNDTEKTNENFGLFEKVGASGEIYNLTIANSNLKGNFSNVGFIAGTNKGSISGINIIESTIENLSTSTNACTGGIVGTNISALEKKPAITTLNYFDGSIILNNGFGGCIVGSNNGSIVGYSYTSENTTINSAADSTTFTIGGLVGNNVFDKNIALVAESFSLTKTTTTVEGSSNKLGGIIGNYEFVPSSRENVTYGCYYQSANGFSRAIGNYADYGIIDDKYSLQNNVYTSQSYTNIQFKEESNLLSYLDASGNLVKWDFENVWEFAKENVLPSLRSYSTIRIPSVAYLIAPNTISNSSTILNENSYIPGEMYKINVSNIDCGNQTITTLNLENIILEGSNAVISNFVLDLNTNENYGFFSTLKNCTIKNITFKPSEIRISNNSSLDTTNFGIVAGAITNSTLENVRVDLSSLNSENSLVINDSFKNKTLNFGGLVGLTNTSAINNCSANGADKQLAFTSTGLNPIMRNINIGGIVGFSIDTTISNSNVEHVFVKDSDSSDGTIGGIVGHINSSTTNYKVINCNVSASTLQSLTKTNLKANDTLRGHFTGGIVGEIISGNSSNYASIVIEKCNTADNNIIGHIVGGIVGGTYGSVYKCTSNSTVTGWKVGGIAGFQYNASIIADCLILGALNQGTDDNYRYSITSSNQYSGITDNPEIGGIVAISSGTVHVLPEMRNCYINCAMTGNYKVKTTACKRNITDSKSFLGLHDEPTYSSRTPTGLVKDCVINANVPAIDRQTVSNPKYWGIKVGNFKSDSDDISSYSTNLEVFSNQNFDTEIWNISSTDISIK